MDKQIYDVYNDELKILESTTDRCDHIVLYCGYKNYADKIVMIFELCGGDVQQVKPL